MSILSQLESEESFNQYLEDNKKYLIVVFFAAEWSDESKLMENVINELAKDEKYKNIVRILQVEAEIHENISIRYNVEVVPTFVFLQDKTTRLYTLSGANATELRNKLNQFSQTFNASDSVLSANPSAVQLETRLKSLINTAPVTLFMKGSPNEPKCGFSRQLIELLKGQDVKDFGYFDILSDQEVIKIVKNC
jgi:thiol-disulfide isomerase/thioredoxin